MADLLAPRPMSMPCSATMTTWRWGRCSKCQRQGIRVPTQMGIVGFNDLDVVSVSVPSITSVRTHRYEMGVEAVRMIEAATDGKRPDPAVIDQGFSLMVRQSTRRTGGSRPMNVLILGAAGMIGRKIAARLAADGPDRRPGGRIADIWSMSCPARASGFCPGPVAAEAADLSAPGSPPRLIGQRPDMILHLAAVVSGEAEVDFDKGYRVNLDAMRALLEAIRALPDWCPGWSSPPRWPSSARPFPMRIPDDFAPHPATSYGTQKLICELL
jgi:hypothetical protein